MSSYRTLEGTLIRGFLVVILVWWEYEKGSRRRRLQYLSIRENPSRSFWSSSRGGRSHYWELRLQ